MDAKRAFSLADLAAPCVVTYLLCRVAFDTKWLQEGWHLCIYQHCLTLRAIRKIAAAIPNKNFIFKVCSECCVLFTMPNIFRSLFSDRYNGKHDRFYERYEAICRTVPNMAPMPRPEPIRSIKAFRTRVSNRKSNTSFHYGSGSPNTDWLQSDDIPIVTRRELEEKTGQLMALQPIDGGTEFSHTIWKMERPGQRRLVKKSKDGVKIGYIQVLTKGEKGDTGKENESHQANVQRRSEKTKAQLPCSDKENRTAEVSFVCPQPECHMPFANRAGLRSHQRDNGHHNWQYQCVDCSMYFRQVNYLNRHRTVCRQPRPANAQTNIRQ